MPTLRELGEVEVLRRLAAARRAGPGVVVDAGDDAAVLSVTPGAELVATADTVIEGRHFLPDWSGPEDVGARVAAAGLSDLAAMGAAPRWGLLSMGVAPDHDVDALIALQRGAAAALERHGASIVGGNLAAVEGPEWFDLALLGEVARGRAWTRSGARPGDAIAVSGSPGRAGAGLRLVRRLGEGARDPRWRALIDAWRAPVVRVELARALHALDAVSAAMDVSDGLAGDLARLCEASGVGAEIEADAWPLDPELERAAAVLGGAPIDLHLAASDDYELLLAVAPEGMDACARAAKHAGTHLAFIGRFTDAPGMLALRSRDGVRAIEAGGFDHFQR